MLTFLLFATLRTYSSDLSKAEWLTYLKVNGYMHA